MSGYEYDRDKAAKRLAELVSQGMTAPKALSVMKSEFDPYISKGQMAAFKRLPGYLDFFTTQTQSTIEARKAEADVVLANLLPGATEALTYLIKKKDIKAITLILDANGKLSKKSDGPKQDQVLEIHMSGVSNEPKDVTTRDIAIETIRGSKA